MQLSKNIVDYSAYVVAVNAMYADRHGYDLIVVMVSFQTKLVGSQRGQRGTSRVH
jgi:hypothetical protein